LVALGEKMEPDARETISAEEAVYVQRVLMGFLHLKWEDKEEIIQECITHCCRKISKFRGDNNAKRTTFLVTAAKRKALSELRRRNKGFGKKWRKILETPWIFGAHEWPSKEEFEVLMKECNELFANAS
jgi:DNA-directed RNA polymerase specialized sigma24 family protein